MILLRKEDDAFLSVYDSDNPLDTGELKDLALAASKHSRLGGCVHQPLRQLDWSASRRRGALGSIVGQPVTGRLVLTSHMSHPILL